MRTRTFAFAAALVTYAVLQGWSIAQALIKEPGCKECELVVYPSWTTQATKFYIGGYDGQPPKPRRVSFDRFLTSPEAREEETKRRLKEITRAYQLQDLAACYRAEDGGVIVDERSIQARQRTWLAKTETAQSVELFRCWCREGYRWYCVHPGGGHSPYKHQYAFDASEDMFWEYVTHDEDGNMITGPYAPVIAPVEVSWRRN